MRRTLLWNLDLCAEWTAVILIPGLVLVDAVLLVRRILDALNQLHFYGLKLELLIILLIFDSISDLVQESLLVRGTLR